MTPVTPLTSSSGDLRADRRYGHALDLAGRGDLAAAADLLAQALDCAPGFAAAWFALGEIEERRDGRTAAVAAFRRALAADPADRQGAALRLIRLGAADLSTMPPGYVRSLFDLYAPRFEEKLVDALGYRGPALLRAAVEQAGGSAGAPHFARLLDLGCGTGLAGAAFAPLARHLVGVDLSPRMVALARAKDIYARLEVADLMDFLAREGEARSFYDGVIAADVCVYVLDLAPLVEAAARLLQPGGLLAFTTETHDGAGVVLADTLRYRHGTDHVRQALQAAGLAPLIIDEAWARRENGIPAPGLVVVAKR
jgi:predicted TPR repeat methyltransferase